MERPFFWIGLLLALIFVMAGCTKKDNPTGNNWSDVKPQSFTDDDSFDLGFSFGAEVTVTGKENYLLCGDYNGIQSATVVHFSALPDSFTIPQARSYADSTWLQLTLTQISKDTRIPVRFSLFKLESYWKEDAAHELMESDLIPIGEAYELQDSVFATGTDVKIPIPVDFLNSLSEAGEDSLSLVIKTNEGAFAEINSQSSGRGPVLRFKYQKPGAEIDSEYSAPTVKDSFWVKYDKPAPTADQWLISNIAPSRIYVRWLDDWNLYKDQDGNTLSEENRKKVTVNKAELIFYTKSNPYYGSTISYSLLAHRVERDSVNSPIEFLPGDLALPSQTASSQTILSDSIVVDITNAMRRFVHEENTNKGLVIRSSQEMKNYGQLELWHFLNAPEGKKPKLRVVYTPPWL